MYLAYQRAFDATGLAGDSANPGEIQGYEMSTVGEVTAPVRKIFNPVGAIIESLPVPLPVIAPTPMLNNNRAVPIMEDMSLPPAASLSASTAPLTASTVNFDWKKYLPWLLALIVAVILLHYATKKRSS